MSDEAEAAETRSPLVCNVVRFVLSQCESQVRSTVLTKTRFTNAARDIAAAENITTTKYAKIFDEANAVLEEVYGFRLVGIPNKKSASNKASRTGDAEAADGDPGSTPITDLGFKGDRFILCSTIKAPPAYMQMVLDQSRQLYVKRLGSGQYEPGTETDHTLTSQFDTDQILALQGIMAVVICIILFSKNNALEQELLTHLAKFGIPTDGYAVPIINMRIQDVLSYMVRLEYIQRTAPAASETGALDSIFYSVDRRTQVEFPQESLVEMCQRLLGLEQTAVQSLRESIALSIGDAYSI
ncbi:AAL120Cp [Eremothecium gossypii ATCC 10895]|uniref:AAL120Cp n=1 Tax=Eremothecium gossypii (strain ATCC 10895 / CBS 109.51 / FGSC 9923 / NRRL Y-1056) TaxID=284811 RepID=Q75F48_EREGS|nr:AAL120Cp [Eremothecium gossypii ATCC 10895]AAS50246.1 AAL120Cp [Eremothecium gossypii ATCC 10895]AEY94531.1 FAAL120Cp [Eremothecium gossypii FDAG1]